jgi:NSS family neurotransmitter:Na+ symporter
VFPFIFSNGLSSNAGPGLVFKMIPLALADLPGGTLWCFVFFALLFFAALTSAISLLEVVVSYFVDEWQWSRTLSTVLCGSLIAAFGIPSALSGGQGFFGAKFASMNEGLFSLVGKDGGLNWFDTIDYMVSNVMLPLGGLCIALFVSWAVPGKLRKDEFLKGTQFGWAYWPWLVSLRFIVPVAVLIVFLQAIGVIDMLMGLGS